MSPKKAETKDKKSETKKKVVKSSAKKTAVKKAVAKTPVKKTAVKKTATTAKKKTVKKAATKKAVTSKKTTTKKTITAKKTAVKKKAVAKPKAKEIKKEIKKTISKVKISKKSIQPQVKTVVEEKPQEIVKEPVVDTVKKPEVNKEQSQVVVQKPDAVSTPPEKVSETAKIITPAPEKKAEIETEAEPKKEIIKVTGQPTVKELAEKMNIRVNDFIKKLMGMGIYATINQRLEPELASLAAGELGFEIEEEKAYTEENLGIVEKGIEEKPEDLKPRPAVVTIMGHVDHGKTSLLDAIRNSKVCDGEKGAITQHIGAYKVETANGTISFVDTPGHEAFTAMRSRGAQVTDIVILVVSATDSVMPQTVEAIDHAKAAGAPIMVAVNKIDLPGANPDKVKQDLAKYDLIPEEWQGKTIFVEVSAKKCINVDKLLDMISLQSEMMNLKANPNKKGIGVILESKRDTKKGTVATVLAKEGTVKIGDSFVVGSNFGKVRAMIDENGKRLKEITPSIPAEILGINGNPPQVGDMFYVVESEKKARQIAEKRKLIEREESIAHKKHVTLLGLKDQIASKKLKVLQVILKGDVQGSVQAIKDSLERISTREVEVRIIHSGAGNINESDILLAKASDAIVLGFHTSTEPKAKTEAEKEGIEIRNYDIIFELLEDVKAAMEGLLEPEIVEEVSARATVKQKFNLSSGIVAGSLITEGKIVRGTKVRVIRNGEAILKSKVTGLKRFKEDIKEVEKGYECGILIDNYKDIKPDDIIETIEEKTVIRRLETKND